MKKLLWAIIALLVIALAIVAFFLYRCHERQEGEHPGGPVGADCAHDAKNDRCRARLGLGPVAYSVWDDGSLAVAAPVVNSGDGAAANVLVSSVTLGTGKKLVPVAMPVLLGEIVSQRRAVLQTRFGSLAVPGTYAMTVTGTYREAGSTLPFTAKVSLKVARSSQPTAPAATASAPKNKTSGVPTAPSPVDRDIENNNELGPPVPDGPVRKPFKVAPTQTGPAPAPSPGAGGMSVTFVRDTAGGQAGFPPDPSTAVASNDGVVLATANTFLLFSKDDGQTFAQVDPTTIFPQSDGGLCCDQVVIYDRRNNMFFWMLQYGSGPPPPGSPPKTPGTNRLRIGFARPADLKTNVNAWSYFDLTQPGFGSKGGLDYPDLAVTSKFLYASVDGTGATGNGGLIVARILLSDITGGGSSVGISYYGPDQWSEMNRAWASRLTQRSADAMYWGGHVDTSHLEVYRWPDNANANAHVSTINTYCTVDFTTLAPDGKQWLDNMRGAGTGAIIAATRKPGEVWLGWDAARDSAGCTQGRPQPYVKIVRIDDASLNSVGEYHIWNTPYAFGYPSLGTAPNGDIGVSVAFGGPGNYASTTVGYLGDYVVYYVDSSDATLSFPLFNADGTPQKDSNGNPVLGTRYGDMFAVRDSGPGDADFSSEGYAYKFADPTQSTNCATAPGCVQRTRYVQWGRSQQGPK